MREPFKVKNPKWQSNNSENKTTKHCLMLRNWGQQTPTEEQVLFEYLYKPVGIFLKYVWSWFMYYMKYTQCGHRENTETPHGMAWSSELNLLYFLYSFSFCGCYNYKEACLVSHGSSWNSETCLCVGSGNVSFTTKRSAVLKLCQKGNMNPLQVMPQRWRMLRCSRKQNDEQRCQPTLRRDNGRSFCHLAPWQSMMSGPSNKPCLLCVNDEHGCNWFIISNQEAPFSTASKRRLPARPHRIGKHSPGVQPHVRALNELSCWL